MNIYTFNSIYLHPVCDQKSRRKKEQACMWMRNVHVSVLIQKYRFTNGERKCMSTKQCKDGFVMCIKGINYYV